MTCPACEKMRYALEWAEILLKSKGCDYSAYLCKEALAIPCSCGTEEKFKPSHEWASKFYEEKGGDAPCDREITQSLTRVSSTGADQSNPESCANIWEAQGFVPNPYPTEHKPRHGFWYNLALYTTVVVTAPVWIPVIIWAANETRKEQKL